MVGTDVLVGIGLTVLAWLGLAITVVRGRQNIERQTRPPVAVDDQPHDAS